jgi:Nif-specific regulatory protein
LDDAQLRRERDLYRALLELGCCDEIEPFLEEALSLVVALTGARRGYIELAEDRDEDAPPRFSMAHGCYDEDVEAIRDAFSRGIIAEAIAAGETIVTESALQDPRFIKSASVKRNLTEAVLCAPLGAQSTGVVYLQDRRLEGPFTEEHRKVVEDVARYLAKFAHRLLSWKRPLDEEDHTRAIRGKIRADGIIGRSKALARVLQQAAQVANADACVLITGPSGTGKTQIASVIHDNGPRAGAPFVEQNCAALQDGLFENELFGHAKGAFSGAHAAQKGRVAMAEGGTLFLDEIADLTPSAQGKLLQLLQSKTYFPVGESRSVQANVRVIAATNADLKERVAQKTFRQDLYFRLDVLRARMPSLAERPEDIPLLAEHFCQIAAAASSARHLRFSPSALRALEAAEWSGNIRELSNCVARAVVLAAGEEAPHVEPQHVFPDDDDASSERLVFQEETRRFQKPLVERALKEADGKVTEAAKLLGISRSHMYNLLETFKIRRKPR